MHYLLRDYLNSFSIYIICYFIMICMLGWINLSIVCSAEACSTCLEPHALLLDLAFACWSTLLYFKTCYNLEIHQYRYLHLCYDTYNHFTFKFSHYFRILLLVMNMLSISIFMSFTSTDSDTVGYLWSI